MADYSSISSEELGELSAAYGIDFSNKINPMSGGMANTSFLVSDQYVLTVLDNHNETSTNLLVKVTEAVLQGGITTPRIIYTSDGKSHTIIGDKIFLLKQYAKGMLVSDLSAYPITEVGALNAAINKVEIDFELPKLGRRIPKNWFDLLNGAVPHDLKAAIDGALTLEKSGIFDSQGLCFTHGDLFGDNMVSQSGHIVALDWETASLDSALLDLGITATAIRCVNKWDFSLIVTPLLEGYRSASPKFEADEVSVINAARYAAVMLGFHRYYRQNVLFPNPEMKDIYKQIICYWD